MAMHKSIIAVICCSLFLSYCKSSSKSSTMSEHNNNPYYSRTDTTHLNVGNAEWKKILPGDVYYIAREKGTERAFTGKYWDNHAKGIYYCAICGNALYSSDTKFESGTGWPSFYQPLNNNSLFVRKDADGERDEVECKRCHSHLGHVFDDGPKPTGKRYCMDGDVLDFIPAK